MNGMTPGQAAYEARITARRTRLLCAGESAVPEPPAWCHVGGESADWEAAGKAAIDAWCGIAPGFTPAELDAAATRALGEAGAAALRDERDKARAELATCRERNAAIAAQSDRYRDERDEAIAGFIDTADRDEYQLVITEMIAHWERIGTSREEDRLIDGDGETPGWRKRGGLEAS